MDGRIHPLQGPRLEDPPLTPPSEGRGMNSFEGGCAHPLQDHEGKHPLQGPRLAPALI